MTQYATAFMTADTLAIFFIVSFFNYFDKYLTALTLKEWLFDHPETTMKKLIDNHEINPLGRWVMHTFGVDNGMTIGFAATELILFFLLFYHQDLTSFEYLAWGITIGSLGLVNVFHYVNLSRIYTKRTKELVRLRKMVKKR